MNKTKAIIYARVSTKEQEETGYSLDSQEKLLKDYAQNKGFDTKKTIRVSESASGKQIRKTFNEMLRYATKNKIPVILCEKIDRLTRNLKDAASISDWLSDDDKREVHFVKESFVVNKNTRAHENLVWDMKVAIARFYANNLSEEVRKGQREKLAQGWLPTTPPLGYKTIGEKGHKIHVIDKEVAPLVRKMFNLYATGNYSLNALLQKMYEEGLRNRKGRRICKSRLHEYLSEPFYYGKFRWSGQIHKGQHEPLISKELFDEVQAKLTRKIGSPQYKKHLPVFKAKIECELCGGLITWEIQRGHWYGHCNHYKGCPREKFLRQGDVEDQLFPYFDRVAPKNERVLQWLEKGLKEDQSVEIDYHTKKRDRLNAIVAKADKRIEEAYKDKIDGGMPVPLCLKVINESTEEKETAMEELEKLSKDRTLYYEAGFAIHELATSAVAIYKNVKTNTEEKRLLLSYIFSNMSLNSDEIRPNYSVAFEFLLEWMPRMNQTFEQAEIGINKGKKDAFAPLCSVLLRELERFRNCLMETA